MCGKESVTSATKRKKRHQNKVFSFCFHVCLAPPPPHTHTYNRALHEVTQRTPYVQVRQIRHRRPGALPSPTPQFKHPSVFLPLYTRIRQANPAGLHRRECNRFGARFLFLSWNKQQVTEAERLPSRFQRQFVLQQEHTKPPGPFRTKKADCHT